MKLIKVLGIALGGLVVLFLGIAAVLPSTATVERSIVVNKSAPEAFALLADHAVFAKWNPWAKMEPSAAITVSQPSSAVGSTYEWKGEKTGHGRMTTERLELPNRIDIKLEFFAPMRSVAKAYYTLEAAAGGTKVTWGYEGEMDYPVGRYFGLMMDGMLGKDYESGLADFKALAEAMTPAPASP